MNPICEFLEWDTRFFAVRVARVVGHTLDDANAQQALHWCAAERIECLYFLADAHSAESIAAAERYGFGLKDVRLTYHRRLEPALAKAADGLPAGVCIRPARPEDAPVLEAIAEGSYTDSRFYFDDRFPRARADELYRTWVRQSVAGQADVVLVLEDQGRAAGFITCHLTDARTGRCGLGGLEPALRGRGLGLKMYEAALRWFAQRGVEVVVYVTQARNLRAQRLFQRLGFLSHATQLWYHKWFDRAAVPADRGEAA